MVARGLIGIEDEIAADRLYSPSFIARIVIEAVRLKYLGKRVPAIRSHFRQNPLAEEIDRIALSIALERIEGRIVRDNGRPDRQRLIKSAFPRRFRRTEAATRSRSGLVDADRGLRNHRRKLVLEPLPARTTSRGTGASAEREQRRPFVHGFQRSSAKAFAFIPRLGFSADCAAPSRTRRHEIRRGHEADLQSLCTASNARAVARAGRIPAERFLPGTAVVPRSYIPFGTGMRGCIGRALAMMELSTLVPGVVSRFHLRLADDNPMTLAGTFSMQPREAVHMWMMPR